MNVEQLSEAIKELGQSVKENANISRSELKQINLEIKDSNDKLRSEISASHNKLTEAITKLVQMEERSVLAADEIKHSRIAIEKLRDDTFGTAENSITSRLGRLESNDKEQSKSADTVNKAMWGVVTFACVVVVGVLMKYLGLPMLGI